MSIEELKPKISNALEKLEASGDIMITTSTPNTVVDSLIGAMGHNIKSLLSDDEFFAITNCLNVLIHDVELDDRDFQTIIGIEKNDLKFVLDKLVQD